MKRIMYTTFAESEEGEGDEKISLCVVRDCIWTMEIFCPLPKTKCYFALLPVLQSSYLFSNHCSLLPVLQSLYLFYANMSDGPHV